MTVDRVASNAQSQYLLSQIMKANTALDTVTAVGLGKENSGVRTAEAYVRGRQSQDGLWYPGAPPAMDGARSPAAPAGGAIEGKERDAARWLTVRALSVLRRVN